MEDGVLFVGWLLVNEGFAMKSDISNPFGVFSL